MRSNRAGWQISWSKNFGYLFSYRLATADHTTLEQSYGDIQLSLLYGLLFDLIRRGS